MARIANVDLPREKRVEVALTRIYGIGRTLSLRVCQKAGVDPGRKVRELTDTEVTRVREAVEANPVEGDLRAEIQRNIKRLMDIGCYRGSRHKKGLPVRGQRTHTNARTRKGPRRRVGTKG